MKCRPPRSSSSVPLGNNGERTERSTSKLSIETYRHSAVKKMPAILRLRFFPLPRSPFPQESRVDQILEDHQADARREVGATVYEIGQTKKGAEVYPHPSTHFTSGSRPARKFVTCLPSVSNTSALPALALSPSTVI